MTALAHLGAVALAVAVNVGVTIALCRSLGLEVTAEGVETSDQEDFLKECGCNVLQGYLFSRAVPAHKLVRSLGSELQEKAA